MCKDGRLVDISLSVSPLLNAEGKIIGASKIARDITERKRAAAAKEMATGSVHPRAGATSVLKISLTVKAGTLSFISHYLYDDLKFRSKYCIYYY